MKKESFLLYNNFYGPIKHLDDKKLGQLFRAIYEYEVNGEIIDLDSDIKMAFDFFKNQLDVDSEKYKKIVERNKQNGSRGGRPKKSEDNPKNPLGLEKPKKADNDNDNENENENDNENDNDNVYNLIERNFGRLLSPIEYEEVSTWEDNEVTRYAIKTAVLNNVYSIKYISRIIENWKVRNLKTVAEIQQQENKRKKENSEELPSWWDKKFEEEEDEEIARKAEAIRNGSYKT